MPASYKAPLKDRLTEALDALGQWLAQPGTHDEAKQDAAWLGWDGWVRIHDPLADTAAAAFAARQGAPRGRLQPAIAPSTPVWARHVTLPTARR